MKLPFANLFICLQNQHRITVRVKFVFFFNRSVVGLDH